MPPFDHPDDGFARCQILRFGEAKPGRATGRGCVREDDTVRVAITSALVAAMVVLTGFLVATLGFFGPRTAMRIIAVTVTLWLLFVLAVIAIRTVPLRPAMALVIVGSVLLGGAAMAGPPNTSTDSARYAWDGIVQDAGVSPYRYVPVADALAGIRPDWLFPTPVTDPDGGFRCEEPRTRKATSLPSHQPLCTAINRPSVPTIYPPAAELYFAAVRLFVPADAGYWPLQLTGLLISLAILAVLIVVMRRRGIDPRWAALWGWSPLVASEAVTNSHVDVLGALLIVVASALVGRGIRLRGGIALGAAIATKLVPVLAAPALLRRQPGKVIVAAVVTFAVLYVPYIATTGVAVIGYLPGYLSEEGYDSGHRFALLGLVMPSTATLPVAAVLLLITAALVWRKTTPESPWLGQLVMIGVALLIVSPEYPWYALMLVPFIALTGRWEWFAVPLALTLQPLVPLQPFAQAGIGLAVLVIVGMALRRTGPAGRMRLVAPIRRLLRARVS